MIVDLYLVNGELIVNRLWTMAKNDDQSVFDEWLV